MLDNSSELRITHADPETFERDLETLLEMWKVKWGHRKGARLNVRSSIRTAAC